MATVYKYPIQITDRQTLNMPVGAEILCAQAQGDTACIWALVKDTGPARTEERCIRVHGTGHDMPHGAERYRYIGTVQLLGGTLVFHVFEAGAR